MIRLTAIVSGGLTDEQLHEYLGPGYCGHCCADFGDEHVGQAFDNVDGRCPDCGSWPKGAREAAGAVP